MSNYLRSRATLGGKGRGRRTPFMQPIRDQFELQLRAGFEAMRRAPNDGAFNALATVIDVIRLAVEARGEPADPLLEVGAWTLIDVKHRRERGGELAFLLYEEQLILNAIDAMLVVFKRISMEEFNAAMNSREGVVA